LRDVTVYVRADRLWVVVGNAQLGSAWVNILDNLNNNGELRCRDLAFRPRPIRLGGRLGKFGAAG